MFLLKSFAPEIPFLQLQLWSHIHSILKMKLDSVHTHFQNEIKNKQNMGKYSNNSPGF